MGQLTGWLFDVYAQGDGVTVWLLDEEGVIHHLRDSLTPSFFVSAKPGELHRVCEWLHHSRLPVRLARDERYEVFSRRDLVVLRVDVEIPADYARLVRRVSTTFADVDLYNADISIPQFYFFEHHLFPLALCRVVTDAENRITEISTDDSPWALDYRVPPFRTMFLQMEDGELNPNHGHRAPLEITYEGHTYLIRSDDPRELVLRIRDHLLRFDPDVILSRWGDSFILPQLIHIARKYGLPLPLNRDINSRPQERPARSYFSYGRIIFKTMSNTLFGRWHIDLENASLLDHGLEGAIEIARLTRLPMQQTVRVSTGTGISAMQVATAYRRNYLVPYRKREPEDFKSALDLLASDKGGLTYQPVMGLHFDVAELDFSSMYPAIMARLNVSPETIRCRCCPDSRVPEIGYTVCRRVKGLVPETLHPLVDKRLTYKRRLKEERPEEQKELYRRRSKAHKWLLVTCFGYLGYKNARFGRIEAHEAVTAYGREALLRAKDIVEDNGFRVLHALTDSLWIARPHARDSDYEGLIHQVERATNLPLELEGIFKWVAFLPSRVDERFAVPNRFFGVRRDGELKIRGIELRRRDTPEFIKEVQSDLLDELAKAGTRAELAAAVPRLLDIVAYQADRLRSGQVPLTDLALTYHLSRDPHEYQTNTLNATVARELEGRGVGLQPGEAIRYLVTDYAAPVASDRARALEFLDGSYGYDVARYTEMLLRAAETVLAPAGMNSRMLRDWFTRALPAGAPPIRLKPKPALKYWGPLFQYALSQSARESGSKSHNHRIT